MVISCNLIILPNICVLFLITVIQYGIKTIFFFFVYQISTGVFSSIASSICINVQSNVLFMLRFTKNTEGFLIILVLLFLVIVVVVSNLFQLIEVK